MCTLSQNGYGDRSQRPHERSLPTERLRPPPVCQAARVKVETRPAFFCWQWEGYACISTAGASRRGEGEGEGAGNLPRMLLLLCRFARRFLLMLCWAAWFG